MSTSILPIIVKADISHLHCDVLIYSTGCFLDPGYLTAALSKRYGKQLQSFLKARFQVGNRPKGLPPKRRRTAKDISIINAGGLSQGFAAFIAADELCVLPGADADVPAIVMAVAGGEYPGHITPQTISELVANVWEELARCYPHPGEQKVIAFPTIGIGRGGAGDDRLPALKAEIEALHQGHQRYPHLVPILMTYSDVVQQLALVARAQALRLSGHEAWHWLTGAKKKAMAQLPDALLSGRLITFIGAGVSRASGLPSWSGLIANLAHEAKITVPDTDNEQELLDLAEQLRCHLAGDFASALRRALGFATPLPPLPSLTHYLLASMPVSPMVTTNYDNLLEQAVEHIKKVAFTIHSPADVAAMPPGSQCNILKIHGDITVPDQIILTRSDYQHYFEHRPAVSALLKGLLLNRNFLFIGYSLRDPNLQTILAEVASLLQQARRSAYAVVFEASEQDIEYWRQQQVHLLCLQGADAAAKNLHLWQFLDWLQWRCFSPHRAWLAEDANELLPNKSGTKLGKLIVDLRQLLLQLVKELNHSGNDQELVDFLTPWLILARQHGCKLDPKYWQKLSSHYYQRKPGNEATLLQALETAISAFESSAGREEFVYGSLVQNIKKELLGERGVFNPAP